MPFTPVIQLYSVSVNLSYEEFNFVSNEEKFEPEDRN